MISKITLKAARVNARLTQADVAQKLAISQATLANWENGKNIPRANFLSEMCKIYGISMDDVNLDVGD